MADETKSETPAAGVVQAPPAEIEATLSKKVAKGIEKRVAKGVAKALSKAAAEEREAAEPKTPKRSELAASKADKSDVEKLMERQRELELELKKRDFRDELREDGRFRPEAFETHWQLGRNAKPEERKAMRDQWFEHGIGTKPAEAPKAAPVEPVVQQARPTAPSAPSAAPVNPTINGGLVDIWNLTPEQVSTMPREELRGHFEKILSSNNARIGTPPRPHLPGKGN